MMVKQITITFGLLMSFFITHCSVPPVVQAPKDLPALEKIVPKPPITPKPAGIEQKKETAKGIDEKIILIAQEPRIDEINSDIEPENRAAVTTLLNTLLADEYVLYVKTQNFHWNIRNSMNFNDLHLFFGKMYDEIADFIDALAERVRALGGRPLATMNEFIKNARLKEEGSVPADKEMIKKLLDDSEAIIRSLRADIQKTAEWNDMGTNNMLADLITKHEKMAWMLRSYLK